MGCVSAKEAPESVQVTRGAAPDAKAKEEDINNQRRRLSVSPQHVGDTSGGKVSEEDRKAPAELTVGKAPAVAASAMRSKLSVEHVTISKKGFVPYNKGKVNQDRELVKYELQGDPGLALFAVMDGHGEFGHLVASYVKENFVSALESQSNLRSDPPKAILKAVKELCEGLSQTSINISFSGTTCVFGLKVDSTFYIGNIGDSRCVLARRKNGGLEAVALSKDQKPEVPEEKERIIKAGGRVEPLPGPPGEDCGPPRVWLAEVDVPGLAMSRSIGDEVSQSVGVISVPEIIEHRIQPEDQFMLWASDGVWEFIKNEEAVEIVNKNLSKNMEEAVSALVNEANTRWTKEEEVVDDITCILLRLIHS